MGWLTSKQAPLRIAFSMRFFKVTSNVLVKINKVILIRVSGNNISLHFISKKPISFSLSG